MIKEIPHFESIAGWKEVPLSETVQNLILLNTLDSKRIAVSSEYVQKGLFNATNELFLRESAARRLAEAATLLQSLKDTSYQLLVTDAYRPLYIQSALFDEECLRVKRNQPGWSRDQIETEAQRYVSIPSSDPTKPSPHSTGGALDLTIIQGGVRIKMAPVDYCDNSFEYSERERSDYYENATDPEGVIFRDNRRLLYTVMTEGGFTNYPEEWWHYDFGDQFWAKISGNTAIYSAAHDYYLQTTGTKK